MGRFIDSRCRSLVVGRVWGVTPLLARVWGVLGIGLDWIGLDWIGLDWIDWIDWIGPFSLARCFPRFYASPPSPLEFGAFLKSAQNSSHELLFDGSSKIDVRSRGVAKNAKMHTVSNGRLHFPKKRRKLERRGGGAHRIVEITERAKTEGREVPGRSRTKDPSFSSRTWKR